MSEGVEYKSGHEEHIFMRSHCVVVANVEVLDLLLDGLPDNHWTNPHTFQVWLCLQFSQDWIDEIQVPLLSRWPDLVFVVGGACEGLLRLF
jgi:hypothetical protein